GSRPARPGPPASHRPCGAGVALRGRARADSRCARSRLPGPSCSIARPVAASCRTRAAAPRGRSASVDNKSVAAASCQGPHLCEGRMKEQDLIYDWNRVDGAPVAPEGHLVELDDETLRDGLQSPSVQDPPIEQKIELLHIMAALGIHTADIGLPGAGPRAVADVRALALEIARER